MSAQMLIVVAVLAGCVEPTIDAGEVPADAGLPADAGPPPWTSCGDHPVFGGSLTATIDAEAGTATISAADLEFVQMFVDKASSYMGCRAFYDNL